MIKRHLDSLFLEFKEGRSEKAAKLHSVTRSDRQESAAAKLVNVDITSPVFQGETFGQKGERPVDGYESTLSQEPRHSHHGRFQEDRVAKPD